jgi:hypothetical protein
LSPKASYFSQQNVVSDLVLSQQGSEESHIRLKSMPVALQSNWSALSLAMDSLVACAVGDKVRSNVATMVSSKVGAKVTFSYCSESMSTDVAAIVPCIVGTEVELLVASEVGMLVGIADG